MMRRAIAAGNRLVKRNLQEVIGINELMNVATRYDFVRFRVARNQEELRQALHLDENTAARVVASFAINQIQAADENQLGEFFNVIVEGNQGENIFLRVQRVIGVNALILFRSINTGESQAYLNLNHQEVPNVLRRELTTPAGFVALQRGVMIRVESAEVETADLMFVAHGSQGDPNESFRRFSEDFSAYISVEDFPIEQADILPFCHATRLLVEATRRGKLNCVTINRLHFFTSYLHFFALLFQSNVGAHYSRAMLTLVAFSAFQVLVLTAKMINQSHVFHANAAQIWIAASLIKNSPIMDVMVQFADTCHVNYAERFRILLAGMRGLFAQAVRIQYTQATTLPENIDDRTFFVQVISAFVRETNNIDDCVSSLTIAAYSAAFFDIVESGFGCVTANRQLVPFPLGVGQVEGQRDRFFYSEELVRLACDVRGSFNDEGFRLTDGRMLIGVHN
jgi:hypothetical protein